MKIKTVFLDRDGIINEPVMRSSIVSSPRALSEFKLAHDFPELYERISGLNLFVVSNQPDVARGLLTQSVLSQINAFLSERFCFREIIYCVHDDEHNCSCRKPKPGMIQTLLRKHDLAADEAVIIGDSYKDILAGQGAGVRTIYCRRSYNSTISCEPDYLVNGLAEIAILPMFTGQS